MASVLTTKMMIVPVVAAARSIPALARVLGITIER
jgi:hypothetical protein